MSSSNVLKRLNCKAVNSTISVQVLEVLHIPEVYDDIPMMIELIRSSKNSVKSKALVPCDWKIRPQDPLSVSATLYRDPKGTCLTKGVTMKLLDARSGKILAEFKFDAASFVIAPNTIPRTVDLKATKSSRIKSAHLKLQISSILGGDKSSSDEVSTIQSGISPEDNDLSGFSIMEFEDEDETKANTWNDMEGITPVLDEEETLSSAKEAMIENQRLKEELMIMKEQAAREKAEAARKLAELEGEVDRLQSESMARQSIGSYGSGSFSGSLSSGPEKIRMNSLISEVNSNVFELSAAADKASRLPPQAIVGQWITVEGKGLGKVLAFHKEWAPGTDSKHTIEFGGPWGGWGGGRLQSVTEKVLLRRSKFTKVSKWGTGEMNGGLLFTIAHPPDPIDQTPDFSNSPDVVHHNDSGEDRDRGGLMQAVGQLDPIGQEEISPKAADRFRARSLARLQSKLPEGWSVSIDPKTQRPFYVNEISGDSQWEKPLVPAAAV